ncbi:hypothetical protein IPZ70_12070 [Streptomyces polychromogenes]|nr:hypothetical protein [Streptomyces polychromogenes]
MHTHQKLHALLTSAGLTVVEDVCTGSRFPPDAGWRVARGTAAPDGAVRAALDAAWWRRLGDADGEFLVAVLGHRIGGNDALWTRVRHTGAGIPGLTGDPGFVALSLDGQVLLAQVPDADGPRVTAVDRLPERLEEAAEAAGRETEAERAETWAAVPGRPAWPLHWADWIGSNPAAPDELLIRLLDVEQVRLAPELEAELVRDGDADARRALAANARLGAHAVTVLAQDPDDAVRSAVALRPDLTEQQRAAVRHTFDPESMSFTLPWVEELYGDADAMRRLAASSHPLVRRSVARRLPPDVVERLARDEDRAVRLFLAESCEDAPAGMLLEVWRWWDGSFSHPDRPRGHPNFPRTGLLRYAADPDGRMRRLALDDPESTPADVARLARDPEPEVRRRAAEDPRLSPADAVRLLNDPAVHVRASAMRSPRLPARVLSGLLHDRDTARTAVTNPAIPVPVLYRVLAAGEAAVEAARTHAGAGRR